MSIETYVSPTGQVGYKVRVSVGKDRNGKYHSKSKVVYGTIRQAQDLEAQMKSAAARVKNCNAVADVYRMYRETVMDVKKIPLKNGFDLALEKPHCRSSSQKRIDFHRNYWRDFVWWMKIHNPLIRYMQDVTEVMAEDYIASVRRDGFFCRARKGHRRLLSPDTMNEAHRTLQQVFQLLKHETGLLENPFESIPKLPARHAERDAYTDEQLKTIFLKADQWLQPLFFVGLFTGLSLGDVCTLRKREIQFCRHHIYRKRNKTLNSSGKESAIPMLPVLEDFLHRLVEDPANDSEYVLPAQAQEYLRYRPAVTRKIKEFLEKDCDFETRTKIVGRSRVQSVLDFHSLRHTFCSLAGVVGIPLNVVQAIVGHMTPRMTALYSRHVEEQERLRWIRLLGDRINDMPGFLPVADNVRILPETEPEPERAELLNKLQDMDIAKIRRLLEAVG